MKLTVRNILSNPTHVYTVEGVKPVEPGKSITAEFTEGEAANIRGNTKVFEVTEPEPEGKKAGKGKKDKADEPAATDRAALNAEAEALGLIINPEQTDAELAEAIAKVKAG